MNLKNCIHYPYFGQMSTPHLKFTAFVVKSRGIKDGKTGRKKRVNRGIRLGDV